MSLGDLSKAVNAQNVKLSRAGAEMITIHNLQFSKVFPRNRINTRSGAADFYSHQLLSLTFDAVVTKTIFDQFEADSTLTARGALPEVTYTLLAQAISGAADDITVTFTASVEQLQHIAAESGHFLIRPTLIIKNTTWP